MFAADGVWNQYLVVCDSDPTTGAPCTGSPLTGWAPGGGTSFAAPIMAGVQALVNQVWQDRQGKNARRLEQATRCFSIDR